MTDKVMKTHKELADEIQTKLDTFVNGLSEHLSELDMDNPLAQELYKTCLASCFHMQRVINELRKD